MSGRSKTVLASLALVAAGWFLWKDRTRTFHHDVVPEKVQGTWHLVRNGYTDLDVDPDTLEIGESQITFSATGDGYGTGSSSESVIGVETLWSPDRGVYQVLLLTGSDSGDYLAVTFPVEHYDEGLIEVRQEYRLPMLFARLQPKLDGAALWKSRLREALEALDSAPRAAEARLEVAWALAQLGRDDEARAYWKDAIALDPQLAEDDELDEVLGPGSED